MNKDISGDYITHFKNKKILEVAYCFNPFFDNLWKVKTLFLISPKIVISVSFQCQETHFVTCFALGSSLYVNGLIYMKAESVGIFWWPTSPLNLYEIYSRSRPSDSPWEPASKMTPSDPCLLVAMPCVVFFHSELGWLMHLTEYYGNGRMWLPRLGHQSHCHPHLFLLDDSLWGKPAAMSWGHPERSMGQRTESSCQKPGEQDLLKVDFPLPAKPSDD